MDKKLITFVTLFPFALISSDRYVFSELDVVCATQTRVFKKPPYDVTIKGLRLVRENNELEFENYIKAFKEYPVTVLPYKVFREAFLSDRLRSKLVNYSNLRDSDSKLFRQHLRDVKKELKALIEDKTTEYTKKRYYLSLFEIANQFQENSIVKKKDTLINQEHAINSLEKESETDKRTYDNLCTQHLSRLDRFLKTIESKTTAQEKYKAIFEIRKNYVLTKDEEKTIIQISINTKISEIEDELSKKESPEEKHKYIKKILDSECTITSEERDFLKTYLGNLKQEVANLRKKSRIGTASYRKYLNLSGELHLLSLRLENISTPSEIYPIRRKMPMQQRAASLSPVLF